MKKILIILMIALMMLMSSCSKDKEQIIDPPNGDSGDTVDNADDKKEEDEPIMAPDFELEDLEGNMVKLSDFRDKKVIINFWATWCKFCVKEMPDLMKLQEEYKDDLVVLYINVGESKEDVKEFIEDEKLSGTMVLDQKQEVAMIYGVRSFPSTLAVNKKGEVVTARAGMLEYEMMEQMYKMIE